MVPPGVEAQNTSEQTRQIAAAIGGDQDAWQALVQQLSPVLRGTIRARAAARTTPGDIEEILQNAWLRIWSSRDKYDPKRAPWIAFCRWHAANAAVDFHRRNRHRRDEVAAEDLVSSTSRADRGDVFEWLGTTGNREAMDALEFFDERAGPQERERIYSQFVRMTFSLLSPPHELICFGYTKLLEWEPRRVVAELGPGSLELIESKLESDFEAGSALRAATVEECFGPLRLRLPCRLADIVADSRTRKRYEKLLGRVVAKTLLQEYFSGNPRDDITAWWWGVFRRVVKEAAKLRIPEVEHVLDGLRDSG